MQLIVKKDYIVYAKGMYHHISRETFNFKTIRYQVNKFVKTSLMNNEPSILDVSVISGGL